MKVVAVYSIKGGVGKTSTAVNIAYLAARDGHRTLICDLDPQAAATFLFRVRPKIRGGARGLVKGKHPLADLIKGTDFEGLDLLPAELSYRYLDVALDRMKDSVTRLARMLATVEDEYDVIVLDCPPGLSLVSENVIHAADLLLVPVIPATLALRTLEQLTTFIAKHSEVSPDVVAFFSMVDRRKSQHRDVVDTLPEQRPELTSVAIPYASIVEQMGPRREPLLAWASSGPAVAGYQDLWTLVRNRLAANDVGQSSQSAADGPPEA